MKYMKCIILFILTMNVHLAGSVAFAQEAEIPVLFDRSYLNETCSTGFHEKWWLYMGNDLRKEEIALSPDGKWIAFIGTGYGVIPGGKDTWIVPVTGGEPEMVYVIPDDQLYYFESEDVPAYEFQGYVDSICFTPDGSEITFCRHKAIDMMPTIESVNIATGEVRTIVAEGESPDWSNDGRYLAYLSIQDDGYRKPAVYDTQTGETWYLENGNRLYQYLDILLTANNADLIGVVTVGSYQQSMVGITIDAKDETIIPIGELRPNHLTRSPDGRCIVYTDAIIHAHDQAMILDTETYQKVPAFAGTPRYDTHHGLITPDGETIIYLRQYDFDWISEGGNYSFNANAIKVCQQPIDIADRFGTEGPLTIADAAPAAELVIANYPNPFNPATTISFSLPADGAARLYIYNMNGQKVRELVNDHMTAGMHEVVWDGGNDSGMPLATGLYVARIVAGSHMATQRMLLMK